MKDDRNHLSEEQKAKEEAYREYLKLRENPHKKISITETPYGSSELRKKQKAKAEMEEQQRQQTRTGSRSGSKGSSRSGSRTGRSQKEHGKASGKKEDLRSKLLRGRESRSSMEEDRPRPIAEPGIDPERTERVLRRSAKKRRKKQQNRGLRRALVIMLIVVVAIAALTAGGLCVAASTLGKIQDLKIDKHEIGINKSAAKELKKFTNIAVLGVDARDVENDSESRSDAMVVVSINNDTDEVKMFSVFRDTLLYLGDDVKLDKVTHAYFYGGAQKSLYALNKNLDLNIEKAVVINWKTVAEVIDALGGIEIDVQESEIEEMNKFIGGTAKTTGSEKKKIEKAGKQTLNGAQAVTYARIRKDAATGDYRRNERMKIVMATTFKKMKQADLMTVKKICDDALPQAKSNLSVPEMLSMLMNFKHYDMTSSTTGWPYDVASWMGTAGGGYAWYGPPQTLESNVIKLHDKFFGNPDYEPSEDVTSISEEISYLTGLY